MIGPVASWVLAACGTPTPSAPVAVPVPTPPAPPAAPAPEPAPPPAPGPPVVPGAVGEAPPDPFVDKGVCPGECCTYRTWTATADAPVLDAPNGKPVGKVPKGASVTALTGEVHTHPLRATVRTARELRASPDGPALAVAPGDAIWVLTPLGEGYGKLWVRGNVVVDEILFVHDDRCTADSRDPSCWAVMASPTPTGPDPWWVQVRTAGEPAEGWIDNTHDVLTGFDACG